MLLIRRQILHSQANLKEPRILLLPLNRLRLRPNQVVRLKLNQRELEHLGQRLLILLVYLPVLVELHLRRPLLDHREDRLMNKQTTNNSSLPRKPWTRTSPKFDGKPLPFGVIRSWAL